MRRECAIGERLEKTSNVVTATAGNSQTETPAFAGMNGGRAVRPFETRPLARPTSGNG